jgi:hypothetical protein
MHLRSNISFQSYKLENAETVPSSRGIAIADITKIAHDHLWAERQPERDERDEE